jgi:hypothetical protein
MVPVASVHGGLAPLLFVVVHCGSTEDNDREQNYSFQESHEADREAEKGARDKIYPSKPLTYFLQPGPTS